MPPFIRTQQPNDDFVQVGETTYVFDNSNTFDSSKTFDGITELPNVNIDAPIIKTIR